MGKFSKFVNWMDQRTGGRRILPLFTALPLEGKPSLRKTLIFLVIALTIFEGITGCFLSMSYSPGVSAAYPSVKYQMQETTAGHLLRSLHAYGAHLIAALLLLCLVERIQARGYRAPNEIKWVLGLLMGGILVVIATTGYLLPWDQYGYWGTKVRTSILGSVPLLGPILKSIALGGPEIGNLALTRFYALHALFLPSMLMAFFLLYLSTTLFLRSGKDEVSGACCYWPEQAWRDALCGAGVFLALYVFSLCMPVQLGAVANPMETYPARPEWYFRWLFETLKYCPPPWEFIGSVLIPHLILLFLVLIPWIDNGARNHRKAVILVSLFLLAAVCGLSGLSVWQDIQSGHFKEVALWEVEPEPGFDSEKFYKKECQNCHGRDGSGYLETTPDFSSEDYWKSSPSQVRLLKAILEGVDDQNIPEDERMPAFASKLSPAQAKALLVDKILRFKPGDRTGD